MPPKLLQYAIDLAKEFNLLAGKINEQELEDDPLKTVSALINRLSRTILDIQQSEETMQDRRLIQRVKSKDEKEERPIQELTQNQTRPDKIVSSSSSNEGAPENN